MTSQVGSFGKLKERVLQVLRAIWIDGGRIPEGSNVRQINTKGWKRQQETRGMETDCDWHHDEQADNDDLDEEDWKRLHSKKNGYTRDSLGL